MTCRGDASESFCCAPLIYCSFGEELCGKFRTECVLCGVDDIAEPIVFVHFLLFDLMGESFPGSPIKENRLLTLFRVTLNIFFLKESVARYLSAITRETNKPLKKNK